MNTSLATSIKKTPYEVVFGQKASSFHSVGVTLKDVDINDISTNDCCIETCENEKFSTDVEVDDVSFNVSRSSPITNTDAYITNSPTRKSLRDEANVNLGHSRKLMEKKYNYKKRVICTNFKIGQNVSLKIPKKLRHSSDILRIPAVIIDKSRGDQPRYRLLTQFGVIKNTYNASQLNQYPQDVNCGDPNQQVSLNEVIRKILQKDTIYCHCKTTCTSRNCKCRKNLLVCSSRCHSGKSVCCQNSGNSKFKKFQTISNNNVSNNSISNNNISTFISVPSFEGQVSINNQKYKLKNTCAVDTWITIIASLRNFKSIKKNEQFQRVYNFIQAASFLLAKYQIAEDHKILPKKGSINFFGSEFNLFIEHYLIEYFKTSINSICDSPFCPNSSILTETSTCFSLCAQPLLLTKTDVEQQVYNYYMDSHTNPCGLKFGKDKVIPIKNSFVNEDTTTQ